MKGSERCVSMALSRPRLAFADAAVDVSGARACAAPAGIERPTRLSLTRLVLSDLREQLLPFEVSVRGSVCRVLLQVPVGVPRGPDKRIVEGMERR